MSYGLKDDKGSSQVNEPIALYLLSSRTDDSHTTTTKDMKHIALSRSGVPRSDLDHLVKALGINLEYLSNMLQVSYRTLLRKAPSDTLNVHISERAIELSELIHHGIVALGDNVSFIAWIHTRLPALDGERPLDYLDTSFGISMINKILGRIEHGVY
jgi:Uncharacterized conserved protein